MRHHPTGGEYGDGATDRLRDLTQRQNRQRDSRERPAICSINLMHAGLRFESAMLHHQGLTPWHFQFLLGRIGGNAGLSWGKKTRRKERNGTIQKQGIHR